MRYIACASGGADFAFLAAALRGHGIPCWTADYHTTVTVSNMAQAIGGMRLAVFDRDFEEASRLLADGMVPEWRGPSWRVAIFLVVAFLFAGVPPNALGVFWRPPEGTCSEEADGDAP